MSHPARFDKRKPRMWQSVVANKDVVQTTPPLWRDRWSEAFVTLVQITKDPGSEE